jgi:Ca2+-binding EF-hand superfamily protein
MPFFKKEKVRCKKGKGGKKAKEEPEPEPQPKDGGSGSGSEEEDTGLKMEATDEDAFSSEVDALFAMMKSTMGAASDTPDIKFGKMGSEMAGEHDFEDAPDPEPEPEPEPKARPVRVKLSKEEKMAKMKERHRKREESGSNPEAENLEDDEEAQAMKRCEELFEKYDADGGGDIDADEFGTLCYDMGLVFEDDADKKLVLTMLDTDGDGSVSLDEFKVWWMANKDSFFVQTYSENVKSAIYYFKKFDEDLSGELDQTEFVMMCKDMKWDAKSTAMSLVFLDTDGDGLISFNEFLAWYTSDGLVTNTMKVYDSDKNDKLNLSEFVRLAKDWKIDEKTAGKILRKYDKDGDGELNLDELKEVLAQTKK